MHLSDHDENLQHLLGPAWERRAPCPLLLAFGGASCHYSSLQTKKLGLRELVAHPRTHGWDVVELGLEPRAQICVMAEPVFRTAL